MSVYISLKLIERDYFISRPLLKRFSSRSAVLARLCKVFLDNALGSSLSKVTPDKASVNISGFT